MSGFNQNLNCAYRKTISPQLFTLFISAWALVAVTALFFPSYLLMPHAGLDASWAFGMNQAVAQGLRFGTDLVFTFGPYAAISTRLYHPATDFMMVAGSLYLAIAYWTCLVTLIRGAPRHWVIGLLVFFTALMFAREALFYSLPLLAGLICFKHCAPQRDHLAREWADTQHTRPTTLVYIAFIFSTLGLLPLVKGSILVLCVAAAGLSALYAAVNRKYGIAAICIASPLISMLLFWMASGQMLADLPAYFIQMIPIISGYTEAMALEGAPTEIGGYLGAAALVLISISLAPRLARAERFFLGALFFVFLFVAFKSGFVRHDTHAITAATAIFLAALLLPFLFSAKRTLFILIVAGASSLYIVDHQTRQPLLKIIAFQLRFHYSNLWDSVQSRIMRDNTRQTDFRLALDQLHAQNPLPELQGTADIYSYNQAHLLVSDNRWSPRPILQSYSAYTPALAEKNRTHLLSARAPDTIFFRVETIDGRLPALDDGASWPVLFSHYQAVSASADFVLLQKKQTADPFTAPEPLQTRQYTFNEEVTLPRLSEGVFVRLEIKPSLSGRLVSLFFKPDPLQITVNLDDGTQHAYRIISGMAASGFLLSPLIETTTEFGLLYAHLPALDQKRVKSFSVAPLHPSSRLWQTEYTVHLMPVALPGVQKEAIKN